MTGIRFNHRVSFPLLALLARKSGVLVLAIRDEKKLLACKKAGGDDIFGGPKMLFRRTMMKDKSPAIQECIGGPALPEPQLRPAGCRPA